MSINDVVVMAISFFLVAILGPIGIGYIADANVTSWDASVKTMFQILLPILWIVSVAIAYIPKYRQK